MSRKKSLEHRINVRLNETQFKWFKDRAESGGFTLSGFIRHAPNIITLLEDELCVLKKDNLNLKKQMKEGFSISDFL